MTQHCKVGDLVDAQDVSSGAWFEATVINIKHNPEDQDTHIFELKFDEYANNFVVKIKSTNNYTCELCKLIFRFILYYQPVILS